MWCVGRIWVWAWVWTVCQLVPPTAGYFMGAAEEPEPNTAVVDALNRMAQTLEAQERHTSLYERVALLEETLRRRSEAETVMQTEMQQLRDKIPELEEEIKTIPDMRKELAEFEAKIEKLVQDYEAKLSALASEVIRLKKYGTRRKDLQTLSDGSNVLLRRAPACPEMGQGMVGERVGEQCLYFTLTNPLNWTAAHHHCQELGGDLAAPSDLLPLKAFLHQAFTRGPSLWLGASYELDEANRAVEDNVTPTKSVNGGDLEADLDTDTAALTPNDVPQPDTDQAHPTHRLVSGDTRLPSLTMLSDEGAEEMPLSDLASLRLMVDHSALFNEDHANTFSNTRFTRSLRLQSPEERSVSRDARSQDISRDRVLIERDNNPSVVDFILLGDVVEDDDPFLNSNLLPEHSNIEERSASRTSIAPHVHSGVPSTPSPEANEGSSRLGTEDVSGQDQEPSMEADEASNRQGSDTRKATMQCMLLRQIESLEYELVGRPCDEIHSFVCEFAFTFDNPLRE